MTSFYERRRIVQADGWLWLLDLHEGIDKNIELGWWEPEEARAVRTLVRPGMTAIDVGANIGWYTLMFSRAVGAMGRVVAVEPMLEAARVLAANLGLNGLVGSASNVTLHSGVALDAADSSCEFLFKYAWTAPEYDVEQHRNHVTFVTLDELADDIDAPIDFMKIDVDGYEHRVLRGGLGTLCEHRPTLLIEVCDWTLRATEGDAPVPPSHAEYGEHVRSMLALLYRLGYKLFTVRGDATTPDEILHSVDLSKNSTNILCSTKDSIGSW